MIRTGHTLTWYRSISSLLYILLCFTDRLNLQIMYYKLNQNVLTSLDSLKCTYHLQDILYNSGLYFLKKQFIVDRGWWDVKSRSQVSYLTALSRLLAIHLTISKPFSSKLWTGKFESFRILFLASGEKLMKKHFWFWRRRQYCFWQFRKTEIQKFFEAEWGVELKLSSKLQSIPYYSPTLLSNYPISTYPRNLFA